MFYMNEYEVAEACQRYRDHAVLGPATATLVELVQWTNANSDGWAYWPKPCRAAKNLQQLIGTTRTWLDNPERNDVTAEDLRRANRPLKSFRTRYNAFFQIYGPEDYC